MNKLFAWTRGGGGGYMKAAIPAGGLSTRISEETPTRSKSEGESYRPFSVYCESPHHLSR